MDVDEESRLINVFWTDAQCRTAYASFRAVIKFDTIYVMHKYEMSFIPFVGVNQYGKFILIGCGHFSNKDRYIFV